MNTEPSAIAPEAGPIRRLVAITSYFNPAGYDRLRNNYFRFRRALERQGAELWTAELAFDDMPFAIADAQLQVRGNHRHVMWQKERLLNLLIQRLPSDVDAVAWIDSDILFRNPRWPQATCRALQRWSVVQPFQWVRYIGPDGVPGPQRTSHGFAYATRYRSVPPGEVPNCGLAWAARADWLRQFGLLDVSVVGGGDMLMLRAFHRPSPPIARYMNDEWATPFRAWKDAVAVAVGGGLGFVPGRIQHLYHGSLKKRLYRERFRFLTDHRFDPQTDLELDPQGLWQWTESAVDRKPEMVRLVRDYFRMRDEDG